MSEEYTPNYDSLEIKEELESGAVVMSEGELYLIPLLDIPRYLRTIMIRIEVEHDK